MKQLTKNERRWLQTNKQDYNNAQLPRDVKGGEGGGKQSQTNQQLNAPQTTQ